MYDKRNDKHVACDTGGGPFARQWCTAKAGLVDLIVVPSPYRMLAEPLREYVDDIQRENPGCFVHVIMGHLVMDNVWEQALHQNSAFIFNLALSGMERVVVTGSVILRL